MEKQARIREIKLNIESEFVLNLVTYFTQQENYIFVGNENEIWLENLAHPKIQLIYINAQQKMTAVHTNYISNKAQIISKQIKRKFLMPRMQTLILNVCEYDDVIRENEEQYGLIVHVENAKSVHESGILNDLFPSVKNFSLSTSMAEIALKLQLETKRRAINEVRMAKMRTTPIVNNAYVALLVLFFVYLWMRTRDLPSPFVAIHYGSTYNPLIVAGEYWRLLISAFMHLDPMHLLFNAVFVYRFGTIVENVFGKWRMVVIILMSAITASLFSFAFSTNHSLGASGVAYGFVGVLIFLGFEMRKTFMPLVKQLIIPMLLISTMFSLVIPNIDHFGHLGGLVGGFLAVAIVGVPKVKPFVIRTVLTVMTVVIMFSGLWINGVRLTENPQFNDLNRALVAQYIELGDWERVNHLVNTLFSEME